MLKLYSSINIIRKVKDIDHLLSTQNINDEVLSMTDMTSFPIKAQHKKNVNKFTPNELLTNFDNAIYMT